MLEPEDVLQSRYVIEAVIGEGGMGRVYRARQAMLGRLRLAVKEINLDMVVADERTDAVIAFMREAETLAQLSHPNLIHVRDFFEEGGNLYLVMDLVDGDDLLTLIQQYPGGLPVDSVLDYAEQLCKALRYLHTHTPPVVFRDLKPANIMVDTSNTLRLIDFGIARMVVDSTAAECVPQGSPGYAPVEQLVELGVTPDARSDIYALGATLYQCLTGEFPPDARDRLGEDTMMPPHRVNPQVPAWFGRAVTRMLALRWEDRFATIEEVEVCLRRGRCRAVAQPVDWLGPETTPTLRVWWDDGLDRRRPVGLRTLRGDMLVFTVPDMCGASLPGELTFEIPYQRDPVKLGIHMLEYRTSDSSVQCVAHLNSAPAALLRAIAQALRPAPRQAGQRRRGERIEVRLRVSVQDPPLQGFLTDLSLDGGRIWLTKPVGVETLMAVGLALDHEVLPDIELAGEVRWCGVRAGGGYECGLCWQVMEPRTADVLALFLEGRRRAEMAVAGRV